MKLVKRCQKTDKGINIKFLAAKTMKELTDEMCERNKIKRLQTSVKAEFKLGIRFATWLGLEIEG